MNRIHIEEDGRVVILTGDENPEVPEIEGTTEVPEIEHGTSN